MPQLPRDHEQYDDLIKRAICDQEAKHYDWLQIKAQAIQESRLEPRAQSHVGARGLMQIMPPTGLIDLGIYSRCKCGNYGHCQECGKKEFAACEKSEFKAKKAEAEADGWARFFDPEVSIRAGLEYMVSQQRFFRDVVSPIPRWFFCLAAYNAGAGHVIQAQRKARELDWDGRDYHMVAACLPRITGQHAAETLSYVTHILEYYKALLAAQGAAAGDAKGPGEPR